MYYAFNPTLFYPNTALSNLRVEEVSSFFEGVDADETEAGIVGNDSMETSSPSFVCTSPSAGGEIHLRNSSKSSSSSSSPKRSNVMFAAASDKSMAG